MNRLLFSLKTCQKSEPIFLRKKSACGSVPTSSGLSEIWGPFFWKKSACGNVVSHLGLPKVLNHFYKSFVQKSANPATDLSHNGPPKIHLLQKPFRLLFPATSSLKSFWTGYFRPFRPGMFTTLLQGSKKSASKWKACSHMQALFDCSLQWTWIGNVKVDHLHCPYLTMQPAEGKASYYP